MLTWWWIDYVFNTIYLGEVIAYFTLDAEPISNICIDMFNVPQNKCCMDHKEQ